MAKQILKQIDAPRTDGWVHIDGAAKWHYINIADRRSLCRRWLFLGRAYPEQGNDSSPDNCTACQKALAKKKAKSP